MLVIINMSLLAEKVYSVPDVTMHNGRVYDKQTKKLITGILTIYRESGELSAELPCVNGKVNGIVKTYYKVGKVLEEVFVNDNVAVEGYEYNTNNQKKKLKNDYLKSVTRKFRSLTHSE